MARHQPQYLCLRTAHIVFRLKRIDCRSFQQLARRIDHSRLHPGANARIKPQNRFGASRSGQKQILQIPCKNPDGFFLRARAHVAHQIHHHRHGQLHPPCPARRSAQPHITSPSASGLHNSRHHCFGTRLPRLRLRANIKRHNPFLGGSQQCQRPVRRNRRPCLGMGKIIRKLGPFCFLSGDNLGCHQSLALQPCPHPPQERRILRKPFGQNIARAFQCGFHLRHRRTQYPGCQGLRHRAAICQNRIQQRLQPVFPRDHRLGAPLGLVGQVNVFQLRLRHSPANRTRQIVPHFALFGDRAENRRAAVFHLTQIAQPIRQGAKLGIIQPPRHLFAITRHKRHCCALVQQPHRCHHLPGRSANFFGNCLGNSGGGIHRALLHSGRPFYSPHAPAPRIRRPKRKGGENLRPIS